MYTGMIGVLQSNWTTWVQPQEILDYVFIFHCDSIQTGFYANAHGMSNAFFTRYRIITEQGRNTVSTYNIIDYYPFAHLNTTTFFPESGHHRVFQFLTQMKRNADSVLWTERKFKQANGIGRSSPLFVNYECWMYFVHKL